MSPSFVRRHPVVTWVGSGVLAVLLALGIAFSVLLHHAEPFVRAGIIAALEDYFHAHVELDSFHLSLVNGFWAQGKGLRIWPPAHSAAGAASGHTDLNAVPADPPLIRLASFRFHTPLRFPADGTVRIARLELQGLTVQLPPHSYFVPRSADGAKSSIANKFSLNFVVDTIVCRDALLALQTGKPGKLPMQIAISRLTLTHVSNGGPMGFDADLTNPRPNGPLHAAGSFGPWDVDDPGQSPISGNYHFDRADLSSFKGIAGTLSSTGSYQGNLRAIVVNGETDTPDFNLSHFGNPLPLHTTFHATVDGTDGDTWLDPVDATLVHSHFTAQGQIVRVLVSDSGGPAQSIGHDINLSLHIEHGRIEDFLALVSRSQTPLVTGDVAANAMLNIPPGSRIVHQRMRLSGHFILDQAAFSSQKMQSRIAELSLRGQGRPQEAKTIPPADVRSAMQSDFQMSSGVVTLPNLKYTAPGAEIDLSGTYAIESGALNFTGNARLQAKVSEVAGGWKGDLLKPFNRFFEKDGAGTEIPIRVGGTRDNPDFGIDFKRLGKSSR